jgi:uncharacterized protein YhfF
MTGQVDRYWQAYLDILPGDHPHRGASYTAWGFGDNPALADELGQLVVEGTKTATASLAQEYDSDTEPLPAVGDLSIILDGNGAPLCIIETTEIRIVPFGQVDPQFAYDEGEGDRSLAFWRSEHERYFGRVCERIGCTVSDDLRVVCERFRVVFRACPD